MDRREKKIVEWAFFNYEANKKLGAEQVRDIAESGLAVDFDRIGFGGGTSDPTLSKAMRIQEKARQYLWARVVEYTLAAFRFEAVYDVLVERYFNHKNHFAIMTTAGMSESTYFYRLDRALEYAFMWAREYELA